MALAHGARAVDERDGHPPVREFALAELAHHPQNPRRHPERSARAVAASVGRFGLVEPLVAWRGLVIAGNARLDALAASGAGSAIAIDVSAWPEERALAFMVAHNRTAEISRWDWPALQAEMLEMSEELRAASGFSPDEIAPLLVARWTDAPFEGAVRVRTTREQSVAVDAAIEAVRESESDAKMSEGRCLELVAADFLAGA